jgi:hypothetical protein
MALKKLLDFADQEIRNVMGDYYIISKSRMEDIMRNLTAGAERHAELSKMVSDQQKEIATLSRMLLEAD